MGIPQFQKYIKSVYDAACKKNWTGTTYDNMYVDMNCVLHHVCYLAKDCNDLLNRFRDYLRKLVLTYKPKKRIYLAADGPAPMAKMMLQRKRRLDTVKLSNGDIDFKKNIELNLTPGTDFMMKLEKELTGFIAYVKQKFNIEVITSVTDADEGEIKIRHQVHKIQSRNPNDTHIIYSTDSDMILLLFTCDDLSKIYQIVDKDNIIHFGTLLNQHRETFGKTESDKHDFVFINLMMGNDYIPKITLVKLELLWDAYKTVGRNRPKGLVSFQNNVMKIDPIFVHDLLYIATKKSPPHLLNIFEPTDLKQDFYKNYVQGLYWCFTMYVTGACSDYRYIYDHKTSPHVWGAMWTIMFNNTYTITKTNSIDVDLYGILLIPEKANILLSKEQNLIAAKLVEKHPIIYEEGRCIKCKNFCGFLNKQRVQAKLYDSDSIEKHDILKRIKVLEKNFSKHKELHKKISAENVDIISKSFSKIRDELRETVSLDDSENDNDSLSFKPYQPTFKSNVPKKRMF